MGISSSDSGSSGGSSGGGAGASSGAMSPTGGNSGAGGLGGISKAGPAGMGSTDFVSRGQRQFYGGDQAASMAMNGVAKGGMRSLGLVFILKKELELQRMAIDLAKDYFDINKKDYQFFSDIVFPELMRLKNQVTEEAKEAREKPDLKASLLAGMAQVATVDKAYFDKMRKIPRYNIGQKLRLTYEMEQMRHMAMAAGWGMAYRYEINYFRDRNNRLWDRRVAVANAGVGVGNITSQGLSSAVSNLSSAYNRKADYIAAFGNGLASFAGYSDGKKETKEVASSKHTQLATK